MKKNTMTWRCAVVAASLLALGFVGCKEEPKRTARRFAPTVRDVPPVLRNTVGAETRMRGVNSTVASGYGFVVGLDGTGGLPVPENIAATMERQMGLQGVGSGAFEGTPLEGRTPRQLLSDRNTAVVVVQAAIPPGARAGVAFDVFVKAVNATSLEGGSLWTTELRPGPASNFGSAQARLIATARGPIFINPFAEPGGQTDGITRDLGRVLNGGVMAEDLRVELFLDNPSHSRARIITSAINSRFPEGSGDNGPIARGVNSELIGVRVPMRYTDRPAEFVELVRHLQIDQAYPEIHARRYSSAMKSEPALSRELSYCLEALGERALPFVEGLYDYPEAAPRLAALRAGSGLGDSRTAVHLTELAEAGPQQLRTDAITLLGRVDAGPKVERSLHSMLNSETFTIRVAAYEALAQRAIQAQQRRVLAASQSKDDQNPLQNMSLSQLMEIAHLSLPSGTLQGVSRELVKGKFLMDRVESSSPLIYITQQREPRIVLFGEPKLTPPMFVSIWSDRFMLTSDSETDDIRLYYRDWKTDRVTIQVVGPDIGELITFLAHTPTPEDPRPGLGMSYSEVVGTLYGIYGGAGTDASFSTERDWLIAELIQAQDREEIELRPETPEDAEDLYVFEDPTEPVMRQGPPPTIEDGERPSLLVPLPQPLLEGEEPPATDAPAEEPAGDEVVGRDEGLDGSGG